MNPVKKYVAEVGTSTENEAKMALALLFLDSFLKRHASSGLTSFEHLEECIDSQDGDSSKSVIYLLASACANRIFGDSGSTFEAQLFEVENSTQIDVECKILAKNEELCQLLTGAAFNASYARYIKAGGSIGVFSNDFLSYIRTLRRGPSYDDIAMKLALKLAELNREILKPLLAIGSLGIFRGFPDSPDERLYYKAVHQFAISVGVKFK